MTYQDLIETVSEIISNDKIMKGNLTLSYLIPFEKHIKLDEHLFYKNGDNNGKFTHSDVIEIEIEGVIISIGVLEDEPNNLINESE